MHWNRMKQWNDGCTDLLRPLLLHACVHKWNFCIWNVKSVPVCACVSSSTTVTFNGQGQRNYFTSKHVNSTDIHSNSISIFILPSRVWSYTEYGISVHIISKLLIAVTTNSLWPYDKLNISLPSVFQEFFNFIHNYFRTISEREGVTHSSTFEHLSGYASKYFGYFDISTVVEPYDCDKYLKHLLLIKCVDSPIPCELWRR